MTKANFPLVKMLGKGLTAINQANATKCEAPESDGIPYVYKTPYYNDISRRVIKLYII